jgi:hypothetical protein
VTIDTGSVPAVTDAGGNESGSVLDFSDSATPAPSMSSARDFLEPMAFFLSKVVKYQRGENPIVDELIGNLRETPHGTADEAIARASDVIRKGDRIHLVVVLSGAVFLGWLLAHQSQR